MSRSTSNHLNSDLAAEIRLKKCFDCNYVILCGDFPMSLTSREVDGDYRQFAQLRVASPWLVHFLVMHGCFMASGLIKECVFMVDVKAGCRELRL